MRLESFIASGHLLHRPLIMADTLERFCDARPSPISPDAMAEHGGYLRNNRRFGGSYCCIKYISA